MFLLLLLQRFQVQSGSWKIEFLLCHGNGSHKLTKTVAWITQKPQKVELEHQHWPGDRPLINENF